MKRARASLSIAGLSCAAEGVLSAERTVRRLPGVLWVYANPATEMAYVEYAPEVVTLNEVVRAFGSAGFDAVTPLSWGTASKEEKAPSA